MDNKFTHREYYAQFVNEGVKQIVLREIGLEKLAKSKDKHLNDIDLKIWDTLTGFIFFGSELVNRPSSIDPVDIRLVKELEGGVSPAFMVSVYKEAARQIKESTCKAIDVEFKDGSVATFVLIGGGAILSHKIEFIPMTLAELSLKLLVARNLEDFKEAREYEKVLGEDKYKLYSDTITQYLEKYQPLK